MKNANRRVGMVVCCGCSLGALVAQASGCGSSATPDGGSDAAIDAVSEVPPHAGAVLIIGSLDASASVAAFYDTPTPTPCGETVQTQGACTLTQNECSPKSVTAAYNAGAIAIQGGTLGSNIALVPDGSTYPQVAGPRFWNGGETISASAAGGTAPAFNLSVGAPSYVTITQPSWPDAGGKLVVSRTSDLVFGWTGGSSGNVTATLSVQAPTADASLSISSVSCTFPASAGTGTVPTSLISQLPTAPAFAVVGISSSASTQTTTGTWVIGLDLEAFGVASSGAPTFETTLELQ